jgi:Tol biopolymer transport system component
MSVLEKNRKSSRVSRWFGAAALLGACAFVALPAMAAKSNATPTVSADDKKDDKSGLTLKPTRKIEFDTDEGTWMSLDVSPDGRTIVFELVGDIYTLPIEGGQAKLIDGGMAFDSQPRFSPDGKWITFLSDRDGVENAWIMRADGSDGKQITKETHDIGLISPNWSRDGQYVYVSRAHDAFSSFGIWMYNIQGGSGLQITKSESGDVFGGGGHNAVGVVPSPDGRYLYFAHRQGIFRYNAQMPLWQVARRDNVTGEEDDIIHQGESSFRPAISPDGKNLVYITRYETENGIRVRNLETGDDRWVKYPITRDDQESGYTRDLYPGYAFLPNGKEIILTDRGKICRLDLASGQETVIPFTAHVSQDIGPKLDFPQRVDQGPVKVRVIQDAVQSPDGQKLAFVGMTHIYVMDIPGGQPHRLTDEAIREYQPAWSPDGRWIAFTTWSKEGGRIYKVAASGGTPQQLTSTTALYRDPAWSPDASRIVALRANVYDRESTGERESDLIWISSDGSEPHLIMAARGAAKPHFTHDPSLVYIYSRSGSLMSVRYDGTDRHDIVSVKAPYGYSDPYPVEDVRTSPDGRWILAHGPTQLYLMALPTVGGGFEVNLLAPTLPLKKLTDIGADSFAWADDGKTITWALGPSFFREKLSDVSFEPPKEEGKKDGPAKEEKFREKESNVEEIRVNLEVPRKTTKGTLVLRGATVVTMKGDEVVKNADVVIEDNRIKSVGTRGAVPAGAKVIDVAGKTITPGFIDTHAHWKEEHSTILDIAGWSFAANLAYGVTSGLDVQTGTNSMFAYQDMLDAGEIVGIRAFSTGPGVGSDSNFQSLQDAKAMLTKYRDYWGTHNIKSYTIGDRKQRQFMVGACLELQMMPTTEGALDLKLNLTHVIDGFHGNEHTLPIAPLYKDVIQMFAQSGIGETPTLIVNYGGPFGEDYWYENANVHDDPKLNHFTPHYILEKETDRRTQWFRKEQYPFPKFAAQMTKLVRAGGLVGVGSHGELQGLGYQWELWMIASGGMTPMEALRSATITGAKIIGRPDDLGSIEPGKLADLIIFDKSPLDDIHNTKYIRWVMQDGTLYEGDTLDEVWPTQKKMEPFWFADFDKPKAGPPIEYGQFRYPLD